jgi:hypothetical protein
MQNMAGNLRKLGVGVLSRKIRGRMRKPDVPLPEEDRTMAQLPTEGEYVSVEKALNSRCSSDYDDDPSIFHWGMFDKSKFLSEGDIQRVISLSQIRRFTSGALGIRAEKNTLFFVTDPQAAGIEKDRLMVESGMHQQAVSLVCAALGIGSVILNLGPDGKIVSPGEFGSVRMKIDPMKPSYEGSYWSTSPPNKWNKWQKGNLPDPMRDGKTPLLSALRDYALQNIHGKPVSIQSLSQLLWAARGRTPHFYKSIPWGLTIPVWAGGKDLTNLLVLTSSRLCDYRNRGRRGPTHSLKRFAPVKQDLYLRVLQLFPAWNCLIVFSTNDLHTRALWEVGYQMLNLAIQAYSLDISYELFLLEGEQKAFLADNLGISGPIAALCLRTENDLFPSD